MCSLHASNTNLTAAGCCRTVLRLTKQIKVVWPVAGGSLASDRSATVEVHLRLTSLSALAVLLACSAGAVAQEMSGPPPVLVVTREQFKPGNMAEHNKQIPAFYALFERAKVGTYRLGLLPVSGDLNHLVYLEGYPSFAEMEATDKKMEDVMAASPALQAEMDALTLRNDRLHESQTVWVARLRSDLSYRPNTREMTGKARYFTATTLGSTWGAAAISRTT